MKKRKRFFILKPECVGKYGFVNEFFYYVVEDTPPRARIIFPATSHEPSADQIKFVNQHFSDGYLKEIDKEGLVLL